MNKYSEYEPEFMKCAASWPITWWSGRNCYVWDSNMKRYLDFTSGILVTNAGHSNQIISKAIKDQVSRSLIYSFSFPTEVRKDFVDRLVSMVQDDNFNRVALYTTGSEATDKSIQIARKYTGKRDVACVKNCYHGNTAMLEDMYASDDYKISFPMSNFRKDVEKWDPDKIAAFILEGYQGWSVYTYPNDYIKQLVSWCKDNNILVIFDEMQSGFKRTGPLFMYKSYNIKPDLIAFGKAAGGGLPLSGILGNEEIMSCMNNEKFASTHSGNTLTMAAGLANLEVIDSICSNNIILKGIILKDELNSLKHTYDIIDNIHGVGLAAAIHFKDKDTCNSISKKCIEHGLMIVNTGATTLKIAPPLTIREDQIRKGVDIIEKSIQEYLK